MTDPGRLLLVDDEPQMLELLTEEFEERGIPCVSAQNGQSAFEMMRNAEFDTVLCDINMPGMNGLELLIEMRRQGIDTPLIFLTGHGEKGEAVQALRYGAYDFLTKPYDRKLLFETVTRAIQFGIELRSLESTLDEICATKNFTGHDLEKFRAIKKIFLQNKLHMKVLSKFAG